MESKKFDNYSNPYTIHTPINEQIAHWLEKNPEITVKEIQINQEDAIVFYEKTT